MVLRGLVKCSSIFFIIFLMCPKRSRLSTPLGKQQEYYQAVRKSLNEVNDGDSLKVQPAPWSPDIIKEKEDISLMDAEPGFDLSDDEIRKLKVWPKGIIPYYIDTLSFGDKVLRDRIRWFLNEVNALTKISFMEMPTPPKDSNYRWVFFINRQGQLGCADHSIRNFTNEGVQRVVLGYDCMSVGGELAEAVLSIAGVPPQHNAPDRDDYINVLTENIIPEKRYLFERLNSDHWLFYGIKYDFLSAGHFHYHKHSRNGRATIEHRSAYSGVSIGETNGFSTSDIKKLRMLYNYIVNKKENKVPECDKLFRKGQNFHKKYSSGLLKPKPRKKPNQYLGLPENHGSEHHEEKKAKSSKDENEHSEEESSEGEYETLKGKSNLKSNSEKKRKSSKPKVNRDPLLYLSDYQTGDDRRRAGRRSSKLK